MGDIISFFYEKVLETKSPAIDLLTVDQLEKNHKKFWAEYSVALRWNPKIKNGLEIVKANLQNSQRVLTETYDGNEPRRLERYIEEALKIIDHELRDMDFNIRKQKLNTFVGQDAEYLRKLDEDAKKRIDADRHVGSKLKFKYLLVQQRICKPLKQRRRLIAFLSYYVELDKTSDQLEQFIKQGLPKKKGQLDAIFNKLEQQLIRYAKKS